MKTVFVIIALIFGTGNCKAQKLDSLMKFASEFPGEFWRILSKFHDFTYDELVIYKNEVHPGLLGMNPNVHWNEKIMDEIDIHLTGRNMGIIWNERMIDKYKNAHWFDFYDLFLDKKLTISREFAKSIRNIKEYDKYIYKEDNDSITYYNRWKEYLPSSNRLYDFGENDENINKLEKFRNDTRFSKWLDMDINQVPVIIIDSLESNVNVFKLAFYGDFRVYWNNYHSVGQYKLHKFDIDNNISFYNYLIKPNLTSEKLKQIFDLEQQRNFYYSTGYNEDIFGGFPDVIIDKDVYQILDNREVNQIDLEGRIFDMEVYGVPRFCDLIYRHIFKLNLLFMSENAYKIFKVFSLPPSKTFNVTIRINHPWYGKYDMDYILLIYNDKLSYDNIDANNSKIIRRAYKDFSLFSNEHVEDISFIKDFINHRFGKWPYNEEFSRCDFYTIAINEFYDLIPHYNILVSPQLVEAIEKADLLGIDFSRAKSKNYVFLNADPINHDERNEYLQNSIQVPNPLRKQETTDIFLEEMQKIDSFRLIHLNMDSLVKKSEVRKKFREIEDELYNFQIKNKVVLPEEYKKEIRNRKSTVMATYGKSKEIWDWIDIKDHYLLENEWYKFYPQLYKAVVIGQNGVGDYIVLIREPDSPVKISYKMAILWHELGIVELL